MLCIYTTCLEKEIHYPSLNIKSNGACWNVSVTRTPYSRYDLMLQCWQEDPVRRPSFAELSEALESILEPEATQVRHIVICCFILLPYLVLALFLVYLNSVQHISKSEEGFGFRFCTRIIRSKMYLFKSTGLREYESVLPTTEWGEVQRRDWLPGHVRSAGLPEHHPIDCQTSSSGDEFEFFKMNQCHPLAIAMPPHSNTSSQFSKYFQRYWSHSILGEFEIDFYPQVLESETAALLLQERQSLSSPSAEDIQNDDYLPMKTC